MGTKFSVADNAVAAHGSNLATSIDSMNANLKKFEQSISDLPAVWKGSAFQAFDALQLRWQLATKDLNAALAEIQNKVSDSAQFYNQAHAEQTAQINQVSGAANWSGTKS